MLIHQAITTSKVYKEKLLP